MAVETETERARALREANIAILGCMPSRAMDFPDPAYSEAFADGVQAAYAAVMKLRTKP